MEQSTTQNASKEAVQNKESKQELAEIELQPLKEKEKEKEEEQDPLKLDTSSSQWDDSQLVKYQNIEVLNFRITEDQPLPISLFKLPKLTEISLLVNTETLMKVSLKP